MISILCKIRDSRAPLLALVTLLLIGAPVRASTDLDPKLRLGGVAWAKATYAFDEDSMRVPDLDLYRVQLWGSSKLSDKWSGYFRMHASTAPGVLSAYNRSGSIFVYQAYIDRRQLLNTKDTLTIGVYTNAFLRDLYRLHGTRFIARLLGQRAGFVTPTPMGVRYEYSTPTLKTSVTVDQTATTPEAPSSHLLGASSSIHWRPASSWLLSSHVTYRYQNRTSETARPSESVFASTLSYDTTCLTLSVEAVGRRIEGTSPTLELGAGLLTRFRLYEKMHLFGQVMSGNQAFQDTLGAKLNWRAGPLLRLDEGLQVALVLDSEEARETSRLTLSLAAAKLF